MAQWKALSMEKQSPDTPQLYVKGVFTSTTYAVFVTDLVSLWTEHLDRRAIMRRAMNEDTTIDPTNGPDQLKTLLEHLSSCLAGASGTSMTLKSSSDHKELNIMLFSKLPSPLEPLRWPLALSLGDQEQFSGELLHPALESLNAYRNAFSSLVPLLKEKDYVIQKLQDKIEVSGMDLSAVFPGAGFGKGPNARKPQREIPGLDPFIYDSWISSNPNLEADPLETDKLPRHVDLSSLKAEPSNRRWWESLSTSDRELYVTQGDQLSKSASITHSTVQTSSVKALTENELTRTSRPQADHMHNVGGAIPERKKMFRKGSQSSTSSEGDVSQFEQLRPQIENQDVKIQVENTNRGDEGTESNEHANAEDNTKPPNKSKRIGKLGGKKQSSPEPTSPMRVPETQYKSETELPTAPPKKSSKLGKIGGGIKESYPEVEKQAIGLEKVPPIKHEDSREQDGRAEAAGGTNRERETSQERADRRRAELKRQLEEKKRAPGAKKKQRKF